MGARGVLTLEAEPELSNSLFSHIDFTGGVVAAVSGGGDSTALLLLLKDHLDGVAPAARLLAVTVDHGLRPDAAAEASAVARLCAERGIAHRTLLWSGPKPSTGLPAAARAARYRLLAEAARQAGIGLILTGHTADDQAETVTMRRMRDGERGLAGMAPATLYDWRTWIVRPLLGVRRAALRDFLRRQDVGWAEDPTNADETFERPRIRAILGEAGERFPEAMRLAARAGRERGDLGRRAAALIRLLAASPADGVIRLDPGFAAAVDREGAIYALRILLATAGGVSFLPDRQRTEALFDRLAGGPFRATLSRAVLDARPSGLFLRRESRNLPAAAPALNGMNWDGRFRIAVDDGAGPFRVAPVGMAAARRCVVAPAGGAPASIIRAALAAEPAVSGGSYPSGDAIWQRGRMRAAEPGSEVPTAIRMVPIVAPWAAFLPSFDLAPAKAVADLVGAPPVPAPPLRGHIATGPWSNA